MSAHPQVHVRRREPIPTVVYDTYWRFATERQSIFLKRVGRAPPPWTDDPILLEYRFTNAYRASDRVSQYLIRQVIYSGDPSSKEVVFRTLLFKLFNRIETWELLVGALGVPTAAGFDPDRYGRVLSDAQRRGKTIYSGAYIMPSGGPGRTGSKHTMHLALVGRMLDDDLPERLADAPSFAAMFELFRAYPTIGTFLAYQLATDVNYSEVTSFKESDFVAAGPGALDGIAKCFGDMGDWNPEDVIRMVADQQQLECERRGIKSPSLWGRPLQLIDCQNLFCEVDKYARLKHPEFLGRSGRTRMKRRFAAHPHPHPRPWYPPKWGINKLCSVGVDGV